MELKEKLLEYIKLNFEKIGIKENEKVSLLDLPSGLWNFNFIVEINGVRKFVIRAYSPNKEGFYSNSEKSEFQVLKIISNENISPKPILFDDSKKIISYDVLIEEYIEGERLQDLEYLHIKEMARVLAKLHSVNIPENCTIEKKDYRIETLFGISEYMINSYSEKEYVDKELLDQFKQILKKLKDSLTSLPKFEEKDSIIHMDLIASNIMVLKNGNIKLVDWESPGIGDPAFDVWAFTNKAFNLWDLDIFMDEEKKNIFLQEYLKYRKDKTLIERINAKKDLWILILVIHSLIQYQNFQHGKVHKELLDRKEKFDKYLPAVERGLEELRLLL